MPLPESASIDLSEARARALSIGAGVRLALATSAFGWVYAPATWSDPDRRALMTGLCLWAGAAGRPLMSVFGLWGVLGRGPGLPRRRRLPAVVGRARSFLPWGAAARE